MFAGLPSLTHEQQQKAVERIRELMAQGMSSEPGQSRWWQKSCACQPLRRANRGAF